MEVACVSKVINVRSCQMKQRVISKMLKNKNVLSGLHRYVHSGFFFLIWDKKIIKCIFLRNFETLFTNKMYFNKSMSDLKEKEKKEKIRR